MPTITFELSDEAYTQLTAYAAHEERTEAAQAKILVLKGLDVYRDYKPVKPPAVKASDPKPKPAPTPAITRVQGD